MLLGTRGADFVNSSFFLELLSQSETPDELVLNLTAANYAGLLPSLAPPAGDARHTFVFGD
jgi:dTDP-glucose 4,6-dehydratase